MGRGKQATNDYFERKLVEVRRRLVVIRPEPMPVPAPQIYHPAHADGVRQLFCTRYNACLDVAFASRWEGFSCSDCAAFLPPTQEEHLADVEAMAKLIGAVIGDMRDANV